MKITGHIVCVGKSVLPVVITAILLSAGPVQALVLDLDTVLAKALQHSHDLKIARTDIEISQFRKDEVRSLYFPSLTVRLYNEYVHAFPKDGQNVVSVGEEVSANVESAYEHSFTTKLSYPLYDFGARGLKYDNAKREIRMAHLNAEQLLLDIRLEMLSGYAQGLALQKRIETAAEVIRRRNDIFRCSRELQKSGQLGQAQVQDAALRLADTSSTLDDLFKERQKALQALSFYTGETYLPEDFKFAELPDPAEVLAVPDIHQLPEIIAYDEEIARKEAEHAIARRAMLPQLLMNGSYRMYGTDRSSFAESFGNLEQRDTAVTLVAEWNLFSGFGDLAKIGRLKKEIQRVSLQKAKRMAELQRDVNTSYQNYRLYQRDQTEWDLRLAQIQERHATLHRLSEQKIIDRVECLEKEIELMQAKMEIDLQKVERAVAGLRLKFWEKGRWQ